LADLSRAIEAGTLAEEAAPDKLLVCVPRFLCQLDHAIQLLFSLFTASNTFRYISDDLNCRTPIIHFHYEQMGVTFAMVVESEAAHKTTVLLQQYRMIDPRFAVLTVAFRTFARICCLDQPELGSLPSHAFTLMVLYYLQQDHVLPVLHQLKKSDAEDDYLSKSLSSYL
jgi:DNA polymerase sigma